MPLILFKNYVLQYKFTLLINNFLNNSEIKIGHHLTNNNILKIFTGGGRFCGLRSAMLML